MTSTWALRGLGYLGVDTAAPIDDWRHFAGAILGTCVKEEKGIDPSGLFVKVDGRRWRIAVHPAESEAIRYVGWQLTGPTELRALAAGLDALGHPYEIVDGPDAGKRSVAAYLRIDDPAGIPTEFFWGQHEEHEFVSPVGAAPFVTGELGFGHAVIGVEPARYEAAVAFYTDFLGFKISDVGRVGPGRLAFMRCTARHHSIALAELPGHEGAPRLMHFMLEVERLDDLGRAHDRVLDGEVKLSISLGRHATDGMVSFYCKSPSKFDVEYGWGGRLLAPDFEATTMAKGDVWGHRFPRSNRSTNELLDLD